MTVQRADNVILDADGIILDVDGTIWDTTAIVADAWNDAASALQLNVPATDEQTLRREFGKTMSDIADDLWPCLTSEEKTLLMAECCRREQVALSRLNGPNYPSAKDILFPTVAETVKDLSRIIPLFIVSNCQKGYIEMVMDKTAITDCITDYECYGNTGFGKAHNIQLVVKRNALAYPIYVGDTAGDANACNEASVPFVWASYGFGRCVASKYKIDTFEDIKMLLDFKRRA